LIKFGVGFQETIVVNKMDYISVQGFPGDVSWRQMFFPSQHKKNKYCISNSH